MPVREVLNDTETIINLNSIEALIEHHLAKLGVHPDSTIGVYFVDIERMTTLHEDWMHEPGPTDVLSFPIDEITLPDEGEISSPGILGDIVICPSFLPPQMLESGRSLQRESEFLVTHGILHLLGMDHQDPRDHARMFALQDTLIAGWEGSN